ncbi:hypothetical protein J2S74_002214 [Evansella vedderi]|uniref:Uncharacterized protein n=1 Tax=Evansella vedderi TaxID=38282 RepID=A0ABT9ZUB2_9BACI|nr:hypothetical protein [Evansella vedderi]
MVIESNDDEVAYIEAGPEFMGEGKPIENGDR